MGARREGPAARSGGSRAGAAGARRKAERPTRACRFRMGGQAGMMAGAVAVSAVGMAFHAVREFGAAAPMSPSSGVLPAVGVQLLLLVLWARSPTRRRGLMLALAATGWVLLLGGAVLTALPLPFLPFAPEQSLDHHASHVVLGLCQLPLVALPFLRGGRGKDGRSGRKDDHPDKPGP